MKLNEFLSQHAVFTLDELDRFLSARGSGNPNTRKSLLTYYRKQGRIIPVRRGLYATVPAGGVPRSSPVDPFLVAAKLTPDAMLAYHTALEFHGKAYSVHMRLHYVSASKSIPLTFQPWRPRAKKCLVLSGATGPVWTCGSPALKEPWWMYLTGRT